MNENLLSFILQDAENIIDKYSSQEIMFYADAMHECLSLELPDSDKRETLSIPMHIHICHICDQACENRAYLHTNFASFFKL